MPPTKPYIASYLQQLIYYSLDNNILSNALFLATRLHAHDPSSPDASYLLSLCHLRLNQLSSAVQYSELFATEGHHLGCAYVFAQSCLGLGRFLDGINALECNRQSWSGTNNWDKHSKTHRLCSPDAAAVLFLLGQLYERHKDTQKAIDLYTKSSKLNPFIWDTFTNLCDIGAKIQVNNIFEATPEMIASLSEPPATNFDFLSLIAPLSNTISQSQAANNNAVKPFSASDPFQTSTRHNIQGGSEDSEFLYGAKKDHNNLNFYASTNGGGSSSNVVETPNRPLVPHDPIPHILRDVRGVGLTAKKHRTITGIEIAAASQQMQSIFAKSRQRIPGSEEDHIPDDLTKSSTVSAVVLDRKRTISGQAAQTRNNSESMATRRSTRLLSQFRTAKQASSYVNGVDKKETRELKQPKAVASRRLGLKSSLSQEANRPPRISEARDVISRETTYPTRSERQRRQEGLYWLLGLFKKLGAGYFFLTQFQCQAALQMFHSIPSTQRETTWVLSKIARAQFEQASYTEAAKTFSKVRTVAPDCVEDMDIYSTALWHLKSEVDLAFLSHELVDLDRLSPQAWCAVGNSFSLLRDHDNAVKCFKRASQLDSTFAYAFTLQGHEHVLNEEYGDAILAYRRGIVAQHRHYNSWYGLGRVYQKLGKYDVAERYFRIALKINPENAVLLGCIGMTLEKKGQLENAMRYYNRACAMSPNSIFARERKAGILLQQQDVQGALAELMILKDLAPNRADIHILLGRLYNRMLDKSHALQSYTTALSLDPLASSLIKEEIEALEQYDDGDRDMTGS